MRVTVRLFARLREIAGASELERDVAAPATIWQRLGGSGGLIPGLAPYASSISAARNLEYARLDAPVERGRRNRVPATGLGWRYERIFG